MRAVDAVAFGAERELSRVVPHDACFSTSTSGIPYFANSPFSLAMISGAASVSAM